MASYVGNVVYTIVAMGMLSTVSFAGAVYTAQQCIGSRNVSAASNMGRSRPCPAPCHGLCQNQCYHLQNP